MFKPTKDNEYHPTKIPIPQSPLPLRRSISLRMKGETALNFHQQFATLPTKRRSLDHNQNNIRSQRLPSAVGGEVLRRGNSFVERGTIGNGARNGPQTAYRCRNLNTESKSKGSSPIGAPSPDGSRTRSLVSSLRVCEK